jgi:aminoglycoside phosphotransferase (APT) family kinase protein
MSTVEPAVLEWVNRVLHPEEAIGTERLAGGYTNENLAITTNSSRYVLRRYRRSAAVAERTCAIEVALARRLVGTAVPMAEVIAADQTGAAAGEPLLLTRYVQGETLKSAIAKIDGSAAAKIGRAAGTSSLPSAR